VKAGVARYSLEELQKIYGRAEDDVSRNARPLILEKLNEKWRKIMERAINFVRESYAKDYVPLTIRQVHYHLIHEPVDYANDVKHVRKLTELILRARVAGLIDWDAISEEESTVYENAPSGASPEAAIQVALRTAKYMVGKNPWDEMRKYVVVITEKRELGPQLHAITDQYYVRLVCTRGYGMWSRLYREAQLIKDALGKGYECYVFFVTDHDPSGLDLNRFGAAILRKFWKLKIIDVRAMLTIDQIKEFDLPPAPTKVTDPRAKWYIKRFGRESWEVDALGKERMQEILRRAIEELIDKDVWDKVMEENRKNMERTEELAKELLEKGR